MRNRTLRHKVNDNSWALASVGFGVPRYRQLGLLTLAALICAWSPSAEAQETSSAAVDFQRDVRPILVDNCFQCHGPDPGTREADLRLDTEEGAFATRPQGSVIVPGDFPASLLYQRIAHENQRRRMPPVVSNKTLTDAQIDVMRRWIEEGASWDQHWSFKPIERPEVPAVTNEAWVRNSLDHFVLARLESDGLTPNPEADKRTLARRLALDLTGLPLASETLERFLNDHSEEAYEKLVDQLLESEHWGEHRARYWLDAARYADTHGIHIDNYREMYPYRDWVIQAFNENKPFNEFTIEQVAGDLLPDPSLDQLIASGFQRNNITTNEGGAIVEEYEAVYAKDRAETTGSVFLGLTVGCATCHDHKFDPIAQSEFYAMTAFFRNTTQYAMDGNVSDPPPILVVPENEDLELWLALRTEAGMLDAEITKREISVGDIFTEWLATEEYRTLETPLEKSAQLMTMVLDETNPAVVEYESQHHEITLHSGAKVGSGPQEGQLALTFGEESWAELPSLPLDTDTPFSLAMWIYTPEDEGNFEVGGQSDALDGSRGWRVNLGARQITFHMIGEDTADDMDRKRFHLFPTNMKRMPVGEWTHVVFTYDGSGERSGLHVYPDGEVVETEGSEFFADVEGSVRTAEPFVLGKGMQPIDEFRDAPEPRFFAGGAIADLRVFNRVLTVQEAKVVSVWPTLQHAQDKDPAELDMREREALRHFYLSVKDGVYQKLVARRQTIDQEWREIRRRGGVTHVMNERSDAEPEAYVLNRGMYDDRRERVTAGVPAVLPPMAESLPRNRLGLARWLVADNNPLTSRVTVNRFWQEVFGTGLVRTSEDFGAQGDQPSHPALLNWLADEFKESGWDTKQFFQMIVTSATYRQSSHATEDKLEQDLDNRLLSRGPRFRMDAEMIRDYALASSGLLVRTIGGPSVKPYQPDGVWSTVAMPQSNTRVYEQDTGSKLYRRSLYTFWKRSAPPASMEIFNAPTREHSTVRRERTNTPLQALVTMNDAQFIEASRHLAGRAMREAGEEFNQRLDYVTTRLLARLFEDNERALVRQTHQELLEMYRTDIDGATQLLNVGDSVSDPALPVPDSAAWTMLVSQLMNLDEVLNK